MDNQGGRKPSSLVGRRSGSTKVCPGRHRHDAANICPLPSSPTRITPSRTSVPWFGRHYLGLLVDLAYVHVHNIVLDKQQQQQQPLADLRGAKGAMPPKMPEVTRSLQSTSK